MLNETGLTAEPTPAVIAPQVVKTSHQSASGDTPHKVSTVLFNGDRPRNKEKEMAPAEHVDAKPIVVGSATNCGSAKDQDLFRDRMTSKVTS